MYGCMTDCGWGGVGWDGTEGEGRDRDTKDAAGNENPHFCTAEQI